MIGLNETAGRPAVDQPAGAGSSERLTMTFVYRNYRGEVAERRVDAHKASFSFDATEWHPEPQWLLSAVDLDKEAWRQFAVKDILHFGSTAPAPADDHFHVKPLEWSQRHGLDSRLFYADTLLGRFAYGTDNQSKAWHFGPGKSFEHTSEDEAKEAAEAEYVALVRERVNSLGVYSTSADRPMPAELQAPSSYQARVKPWLDACFGPEIAIDKVERNHRFLEEALELVQSTGCSRSEARQLVDYVFGRPAGDPDQEVGGVMNTLAALCLAHDLDMHEAGERELTRVNQLHILEKIRAKQKAKPKHSPLPEGPDDDLADDRSSRVFGD